MKSKCLVETCLLEANASKGYCRKHYSKLQRYGDPNYQRKYNLPTKCSIEGCERKAVSKGICSAHRMKLKRSGTLDKIVGTDEWRKKIGKVRLSELAKLDSTKDPKYRGYLAVNVVDDLKQKARKRGIEWLLTPIEAYKLITADCNYCGSPANWPNSRNGIDRVDNHKSYHNDNCITACSICNSAKSNMSLEDFITWVKIVYAKLTL